MKNVRDIIEGTHEKRNIRNTSSINCNFFITIASYRSGKNDAFKEFKELVNEIQRLQK